MTTAASFSAYDCADSASGASTITRTSCSVPGFAQQHASGLAEFRLSGGDSILHALVIGATILVDVAHVDEHLRVDGHHGRELGERLLRARHLGDQVQARQHAVTGGGELAHDDVPRLLTTQCEAVRVHVFEHVPVADGGLPDGDAVLLHRPVEPEVAHNGRDEGVVGEVAALFHRHGQDRHDLVTVDDGAVGIHRQAAVGVAVVCDSDVCTQAHDGLGEVVEVRGADAIVDVDAVGVGADHGDGGPGILECLGRHPRCRAVRAVEHHVYAVEGMRQGAEQMQLVAVLSVGEALDAPDTSAGRQELVPLHRGFDALLDDVGKLHAAAGEDLDAVVGCRVVRRRDHDAEVGIVVADEEGQCRGGHDSRIEDVDSGCCEAGRYGGDEEFTGDARVAGDDGGQPAPFGLASLCGAALAQDDSGRLGQGERQIGGEDAIGKTSHAVCAEKRHRGVNP